MARRLGERPRLRVELPGFAAAAVLVPIVTEAAAADRLLFTERHAGLSTHAGQISFPGGRRDPGDADAVATALRETDEELGLLVGGHEVLGLLDDVATPSRFVITPVVARLRGPLALTPSRAEVQSVFAAELFALDGPDCYHDAGEREFLGLRYHMHEYRWQAHRIWGATARMVHQLLELIGEPRERS